MHDRPLKRPAMYNAINSSTANLVGSPHQHGRSNSVSSSISTVKRSASFSSNSASTTVPTHRPSESVNETNRLKKPAALSSRRRSSVAHAATDGISGFNGVGNLNRWSQSTTSSKSSGKEPVRANFSRRLSASNPNFFASNGSAGPKASPPRYPAKSSRSSPPPSPRRRHRPSSPNHSPSQSVTTLPILSAKVYDPKAPISTPSTSDAYTPASQSTGYSDYFSTPTFAPGHDRSNTTPNRPGRTELDRNGLRLPQSAGGPGSTSQHPQRLESRERGGSRDLGHRRAGSSVDSRQHSRDPSDGNRQRGRREKDKKTMLSRALQKANTAVLLDNASNFEGAIEAYSDACSLLQQVMIRSSGEEDRRKLEAIRVTYTNRIEELRQLGAGQETSGKSLPARPMSNESFDIDERSILLDTNDDDDEIAVIQTATMTRILNDPSIENQNDMETSKPKPSMLQQDSVLTGTLWDERSNRDTSAEATFFLQQSPPPRPAPDRLFGLESPMDTGYLPQPLSSARHFTSNGPPSRISADNDDVSRIIPAWEMASVTHSRNNSGESISWLNTKDDDSGASSCSSSVHSISSRSGVRRKHLHTGSGATEAEFDAALDAAVEAAYDDGYEPYDDDDPLSAPDHIQSSLRNVELAKERVREMEREEAIVAARRRDKEMRVRGELLPHVRKSFDFEYENSEAEEEERILEEMRKDYLLDDFDFGLQNKSALPRESDSSAYSNSTWNSSSFSSKRTTGGLSLTTVTEASESSRMSQVLGQGSQKPLPATALPPILDDVTPRTTQIEQSPPPPPPANVTSNQGVRDRRLSGQNPKQLKIETSISLPTNQGAPLTQQPNSQKDGLNTLPPYPKSAFAAGNKFPSLDAEYEDLQLPNSVPPSSTTGSGQLPALGSADTLTTISPATPQLGQVGSIDNNIAPGSPIGPLGRSHPSQLRKNKSSLSLKNRNLSVSSPDGSEGSVGTPLSSTFTVFPGRKQSSGNILQTPMLPTFSGSEALPTGGMHLFESDIHSPYSPGSPNPMAVNAPIPLEPCPDSYMLRPFWLMRCFYQTIAHPRGGYLSTKLFVPRDVWRVKGVKIKATEEKISNCDLLTAALLKLGAVDSNDADAMLEEMQSLENVLDQVQTNLMKKLGNEVGVQGVQTLFKEAYAVGSGVGSDTYPNPEQPKSAVSQSKNYLTSWRKLRSKNSAVGLASTVSVSKEVTKDSLTMSTLPMTSLPNIRFAKRDISHVEFSGPNATYMSALARLFDAAQVIDQIARQVEDPGLKHSSPTHVGLELSTRHAAEFFGFYICRFVLTDLTVMLDKFIKRGSEWVLV